MVAGELFVRALPIEHDLEAGAARLLEDAPLRKDAGAAIGLVLVPGDLLGLSKDVFDSRIAPVRNAVRQLNHRFHKWALVDRFDVVAGADIVNVTFISARLQFPCHQADDRGTVEPT